MLEVAVFLKNLMKMYVKCLEFILINIKVGKFKYQIIMIINIKVIMMDLGTQWVLKNSEGIFEEQDNYIILKCLLTNQ